MSALSKGSRGDRVAILQCMLNVALDHQPPLRTDGDFGSQTEAAVKDFETRAGAPITGMVDPAGERAIRADATQRGWAASPPPGGSTPLWLRIARGEDGQKERPGAAQNPRILDYIATVPGLRHVPGRTAPTMADQDETAWCACFVNWCLLRAGQFGGPDAMAASWRGYGIELDAPVEGCVAIIFREPTSDTASGFHVAFFLGALPDGRVRLYGGNQSNMVCEKAFGFERIWYRWPSAVVEV